MLKISIVNNIIYLRLFFISSGNPYVNDAQSVDFVLTKKY